MVKFLIAVIILSVLGIIGAKIFSEGFLLTTGLHPTQVDNYVGAMKGAEDIKIKMENGGYTDRLAPKLPNY